MRARKRVLAVILFLAMLATCLLCSCAAGGAYYKSINISDAFDSPIVYSDASKESAKELALSMAEDVGGSSLPPTAVEEVTMVTEACISHMEQRGVSESDFIVLCDFASEHRDEIVEFMSEDGYDESDFYAFADFMGSVSSIVGAETASLLAYDFSCVYLRYEYEDEMALYDRYGYNYQLRNALQWKDRLDALQNIGEDNVSFLLRATLSVTPLLSEDGLEETRASISSSEASLYLEALGEMLQRISMDDGQWHDLFFLLSEIDDISKIDALYETGACDAAALYLSDLLYFNAAHLQKECDYLSEALLSDDLSTICKKLLGLWTDEEWGVLDGLLSACDDEESYVEYLEEIGESERYLVYRDSIEAASREEVVSGEGDFFEAFEGYIGGMSPFAAFVLFEL